MNRYLINYLFMFCRCRSDVRITPILLSSEAFRQKGIVNLFLLMRMERLIKYKQHRDRAILGSLCGDIDDLLKQNQTLRGDPPA